MDFSIKGRGVAKLNWDRPTSPSKRGKLTYDMTYKILQYTEHWDIPGKWRGKSTGYNFERWFNAACSNTIFLVRHNVQCITISQKKATHSKLSGIVAQFYFEYLIYSILHLYSNCVYDLTYKILCYTANNKTCEICRVLSLGSIFESINIVLLQLYSDSVRLDV